MGKNNKGNFTVNQKIEKEQEEEYEKIVNPKTGDCHLECKQKGFRLQKLDQLSVETKLPKYQRDGGKQAHEFIGPIRIVLVTSPKGEYNQRIWGSAAVLFAYFTIGATIMPIFFYSLSFTKDKNMGLHVILFTAGMLTPAAFLVMNVFNGSSSILKARHRKLDFVVLKVTALICLIGGIISLKSSETIKKSVHGFAGLAAVILYIIDIFTMPIVKCNTKRLWPKLSLVLCIPSFLTSTLCFILSLSKPSFVKWLPLPMMQYIIMFFCIFYNIISIYNPISNLINTL